MQNYLETSTEKLVFVLSIPIAAALIFGIMMLGAVYHHHGYGVLYQGRFEGCGRRLSETIIELKNPGGTIYIVDGVWIDMTGRFGAI